MAPRARSRFGAPMFETEFFRKQMYVLKKVRVTLLGLFGPPQWFGAPKIYSTPEELHPSRYTLGKMCFAAGWIGFAGQIWTAGRSLENPDIEYEGEWWQHTPLLECFACNCGSFAFIVVWCIARQADRNGETVNQFHNCIEVLSQLRTPCCTILRQYSNRSKRGGAYDNAQIASLQFSLPTSAPENCVDL